MSGTFFDTCPASVAYSPTVNIFMGTLFPELLDGPAVDVDVVAAFYWARRAVMDDITTRSQHT